MAKKEIVTILADFWHCSIFIYFKCPYTYFSGSLNIVSLSSSWVSLPCLTVACYSFLKSSWMILFFSDFKYLSYFDDSHRLWCTNTSNSTCQKKWTYQLRRNWFLFILYSNYHYLSSHSCLKHQYLNFFFPLSHCPPDI